MTAIVNSSQNSPENPRQRMGELSTDKQSASVEWLFEKLGGLYGREFTGKFDSVAAATVKSAWIAALQPYNGLHIAKALRDCQSLKKAPNAPEFGELCRLHWEDEGRRAAQLAPPQMSHEQRAQLAEVARMLSKRPDDGIIWTVNGADVEPARVWALRLLQRAELGEKLSSHHQEAVSAALPSVASGGPIEITFREVANAQQAGQ